MEAHPPSRDRFINLRVFVAFTLCSAALGFSALSFAQTPSPSGSWGAIASPNATASGSNVLEDVTCVSATDCWAVGSFFGSSAVRTLIQHWDGSSWSIVASPNMVATGNNQHNQLVAVTCSSASDCWAVSTHRDQEIDRTLILR